MKLHKKIPAVLLTASMVLSMLTPVRAAEPASEPVGDLQATLRIDYIQELSQLQDRNIQAELFRGQSSLGKIGLTQPASGNFGGCTAQVSLRDRLGGDLIGSALPGALDLSVEGLPQGSYTLRFTGQGYASCDARFTIGGYSQYVEVGTGDGTFALGDFDGSGRVDARDREAVSNALGSTSRADLAEFDLNGDGQIDIVDLAYVNHNVNTPAASATVLDTASIDVLMDTAQAARDLAASGTVVRSGDLNTLLEESGAVTFQSTSEGGDIRIPVPLSQAVVAEHLQIVTPDSAQGAIQAGSVEVEYEGGTISCDFSSDTTAYPGTHAITRTAGTNVIVIPLGSRVAVKKVTVTVTKTAGGEYATVDTIRFLKDIAPEELVEPNSQVKNLSAAAGDSRVSLTWERLSNVSGYRVEYWQEGGESARRQLAVDVPEAQITGLDNMKTYYFTVTPVDGSWQGRSCAPVAATPQPAKAPAAPDMVTVTPLDGQLEVSWKGAENATYYEVYYTDMPAAAPSAYRQSGGQVTGTRQTISGLSNGVTYYIYVAAGNDIGKSGPSRIYTGVPVAVDYSRPEGIPTQGVLDSARIAGIALADPSNYNASQYPGSTFSIRNVIDNDYRTHWTARDWSYNEHVEVTFDRPVDLSAAIWVPRLDGSYPSYLRAYSVQVWYQGEDLNGAGHLLTGGVDNGGAGNNSDVLTWPNIPNRASIPTSKFAILPFGPATGVVKISVAVEQWDYNIVSLSELMFLEYDPEHCLPDNIAGLFADELRTQLAPQVTQDQIDSLRARLNSDERNYYMNPETLDDELDLAQELLTGGSTGGVVLRGVQSRSSAADSAKYQQGGSDLQPLGAAVKAGQEITIYASGIPDGERVTVYATQFNAEVSAWRAEVGSLVNGRNILTVPKIGSQSTERGGSLYFAYSGSAAQNIQLHVRRAVDMPVLELSDWYKISEAERRARIGAYVDELTAYVPAQGIDSGSALTKCLNVTEIATPTVLLSLPAAAVLSANGQNREDKVENLYQDVLAWEDLMHICKTTQGIDNTYENNDMTSRQNIRCMQMFTGAFMYAAGSHVGIGYGSCAGMVSGRPIEKMGEGASANSLFGWGIAHEIGHNMDKLGRAEITNNIYSLMVQTYDGGQNTLTSRLEGGKYPAIFTKTAQAMPGESNDVFVQLGMYWQLHLAYDGGDSPMDFYNRFFKAWKAGTYTQGMTGLSYDEKVALTASGTAGRDLTGFFTHWGMDLSGEVKAKLAEYEEEDRALWYLSDQSRRDRLQGAAPASGSITVEAQREGEDSMTIAVTITPDITGSVQGYEIWRNDEPIAFVPAPGNSGSTPVTFTDAMGSAGNRLYTYRVAAYGVQGGLIGEDTAQSILLTGLEGDEVAFHKTGTLGVLAQDYVYGPEADDVISAGTIVITGSYRGDPRFLTMEVRGRFTKAKDELMEDILVEERAIDGYALFFAGVPEEGTVGEVSDGIFLFVPNLEREAELQEGSASQCSGVNLLPSQIQAVLYRTDTSHDASVKRKTAETMWIYTPGGTDLPAIVLEGGA